MKISIGMTVELNGMEYKVVGTVARSWVLEKDGKRYKATSAMIGRIKNQPVVNNVSRKKPVDHMAERLRFRRIFDKSFKLPETEAECLKWLDMISCDLSPENLHCDGEISRSAARVKAGKLRSEWRQVEKILGYKISEDEVERIAIENYRKEYEMCKNNACL